MGAGSARVARLMEQDIHRRGLSSGEPYLTAAEAGRVFGVHPRMASRAMKRLAERRLLLRKQGVGTFVGPAFDASAPLRLRVAHVLVSSERYHADLPVGDLTAGLLEELAGYDMQLNILPPTEAVSHVRRLIDKASSEGWMSGLVLLGCSRDIQELAVEKHAPAVVFGGVFATTRSLSSVDVDQRETGRLMARYVVERGHRRIGLVTHDTWLPGDNELLDGVNEVLHEAGLNQGSLVVRSLPVDAAVAVPEVRHLLSEPEPPRALICRGRFFGRIAQQAARSLGPELAEGFTLIADAVPVGPPDDVAWPHVSCKYDFRAQAGVVGRLLRQRIEDESAAPQQRVLPVRLIEPSESRHQKA